MKKSLIFALVLALLLSLAVPALAFGKVQRSTQYLNVDGKAIDCDKYNIDDENYFKLRDLAFVLNGTGSQFDVGYDETNRTVAITTNHAYTQPDGTELKIGADKSDTTQISTQPIVIDGKVRTDLKAYNIGDNNYFRLKDLGTALGFDVKYDEPNRTMLVTSRSAAGGPITLTDMTGREITLTEPVERIIALQPSDCEILYAVGAGDKLVATGEYCDYPAEVLSLPSVSSGYNTNVEEIIALDPDVLVMSTMSQDPALIPQFEAAGIKVVVSDAQDIEGVYTAIRMIGKLMGKDDNAEKIVQGMKSDLAELQQKAAAAKAAKGLTADPTIYFEVSPLQWGLWTAGGGTFMNEVAELLGLKNIFADEGQWAQISEEQVIERNPDYIMTITMYFGEGDTPEQEITSRPGWSYITAVQNGAILRMEHDELSRPAPRIVDGAKMLYALVYGE